MPAVFCVCCAGSGRCAAAPRRSGQWARRSRATPIRSTIHAFSLDRGRRLLRQLCLSDPPGVSRTRQLWCEPVFILAFCEGAGLPRSRTNLEYRRRVQMRTDNQAAKSKSNTNTTLRSSWLMRGTRNPLVRDRWAFWPRGGRAIRLSAEAGLPSCRVWMTKIHDMPRSRKHTSRGARPSIGIPQAWLRVVRPNSQTSLPNVERRFSLPIELASSSS